MNSHDRVSRLGRLLAGLVTLLTAGRTVKARVTGRPLPPPAPAEVDVDPSEREVPANRRAEALAALFMVLSGIFFCGFPAVYILAGYNTQLLGVTMGGGFLFLAFAFIIIGKEVVPQETHVESRDQLLEPEETKEVVDMITAGGEGISRRGLLLGAGGVAGTGLLVAVGTGVASLGPPLNNIHGTQWHRGRKLVDDTGKVYKPSDIEIGTFYTALPKDSPDPDAFNAALIVVRLPADYIHLPPARVSWAPQGILAYSKICPHAGCAISLYRYPLYAHTSGEPAFTCPCHYSTFLPGEGGRLSFGPAGRALPQLALMIDADGDLAAAQGFIEDIGPSWWNIHRGEGGRTQA